MAPSAPAPVVVQKFKPTGGVVVGYTSLVVLGGCVVLALITEPNLLGVRIALALLLVMSLTYVSLLRPRADATVATLRLRNLFSDHHVPLAHVDEVLVRQMLVVRVGQDRYTCVGIGRSARQLMGNKRKRGPMAVLGIEQTDDRMAEGQSAEIGNGADYATFVETRIEDLVRTAKRDLRDQSSEVRREWAQPEIVVVVGLAVAFALSLLV